MRIPGRKTGKGRFARIPLDVLESRAVKTLPHAAFRVMVLLAAQYTGYNNGALGITANHDYQTFSLPLAPGDAVLLYTDGVCEATSPQGVEFGAQRLQRTIQDLGQLPLNEMLARVVQAAREFSGSRKVGDDICLLGCVLHALRE